MNQETNTHETMNRQLHEARGLGCWHVFRKLTSAEAGGYILPCQICGKEIECSPNHRRGIFVSADNPDYLSSLTDAFSLVEWMQKEKGFDFMLKRDAKSSEYFAMLSGRRVIDGYRYHENPATAIATACYAALGLEGK